MQLKRRFHRSKAARRSRSRFSTFAIAKPSRLSFAVLTQGDEVSKALQSKESSLCFSTSSADLTGMRRGSACARRSIAEESSPGKTRHPPTRCVAPLVCGIRTEVSFAC